MNSRKRSRLVNRLAAYGCLAFLGILILGGAAPGSLQLMAAEQNANEIIPPTGPAWVRPKPPMSWAINFKYLGSLEKDPARETRPVKITVSAIGSRTLENITFPKAAYDVWTVDGFVFLVEVETGRFGIRLDPSQSVEFQQDGPVLVLPPPTAEYQDWVGLKEFDWVKSELFRGAIKQGTEILHVYAEMPADMVPGRQAAGAPRPGAVGGRPAVSARPATKWPVGPIGGLPLRPDIKVVAVNAETRQPRFLQLGETLREYVFSTPTAAALEVPAPILQRMKTLGR
jgi:hypothetical protein